MSQSTNPPHDPPSVRAARALHHKAAFRDQADCDLAAQIIARATNCDTLSARVLELERERDALAKEMAEAEGLLESAKEIINTASIINYGEGRDNRDEVQAASAIQDFLSRAKGAAKP